MTTTRRTIATANQIARTLRNQGNPTTGDLPVKLWELLSGGNLPGPVAARLYRKAGYMPFAGYPLTRCH